MLVDGAKLSRLMIRYGVGVQVRRTVQIVDVDEDFFEQWTLGMVAGVTADGSSPSSPSSPARRTGSAR